MGTNFYLQEDTCPHCNRGKDQIHIGKSSAGWCFALHIIPDESINSLADWQIRWEKPNAVIYDEYGDIITSDEMLSRITEREWKKAVPNDDAWYVLNHAQRGPNGLARAVVDGRRCIANGDGTYDLIIGEFS